MRRRPAWQGPALAAGAATAIFALAAIFLPARFETGLRLYLIVMAAIAILPAVDAAAHAYGRVTPGPLSRGRRDANVVDPPEDLLGVESALRAATWNRAEVERRLRPLVAEITDPATADRLLGERGDARGPGLSVGDLARIVDALEAR
jgi:hypothetical protein